MQDLCRVTHLGQEIDAGLVSCDAFRAVNRCTTCVV